jgi:predicted nucleotidyltransferase
MLEIASVLPTPDAGVQHSQSCTFHLLTSLNLPDPVSRVTDLYLRALDELAPGLVDAVYLTGSVAMGDFRSMVSDVDFVAVSREPIGPARAALRRAHERVRAARRRPFFDGVYVTWEDLQRNPAEVTVGAVVHEGRWKDNAAGAANPITWHELAWHGVTVRGPEPHSRAVWTDAVALVEWTRHNMRGYWRPWHARAARPLSMLGVAMLGEWAPAWGVLGVARQRYTLATGRLTSKTGAGTWARDALPEAWRRVLDECVRLRSGIPSRSLYASRFARRGDALRFMEYAIQAAAC